MFAKIVLTIKFILLVSIFGKKGEPAKNIIVIDGPSSVSVSNRISFASDKVSYFVPFQYMPTVLKSGLALDLIITPTFSQYVMALVAVFGKLERKNASAIFIAFPAWLIYYYIEKNNKQVSNVVVFNERGPFACSAIAAAKKYNIRTCCIQHGAIVENYFPIDVDLYFTWSGYFSDVIKERCPHVLTINVGRLDYTEPQTKLFKRLDMPLVALQPAGTSIPYEILLDNFVDVVEVCLDVFDGVVLRRHPNDNISADLLSVFREDKRIFFDNDVLDDALAKRKLVISLYSTVLLDAAMSGCVAVQYVSDSWFNPIFQRSSIVMNGKKDLKIFLKDIGKRANFYAEEFGHEIIGKPNYELFFDKLRLV